MNLASSAEPRHKFSPKRFGRGLGSSPDAARKQVRFEQDDAHSDQAAPSSSLGQPSRPGRMGNHVEQRPKKSYTSNLASFATLIIVVYLFIRDGWASLVASCVLPSHVRPPWTTSVHQHQATVDEQVVTATLAAYIEEAVYRAMNPVLLRDYALAADGGMVFDDLTWAFYGSFPTSSPELLLDDDTRVGHCWHFPGSRAQVAISLPEFIHPTHVTIDHIPAAIAADVGQAPRRMILWGVVDGSENRQRYSRGADDLRGNSTIGRDHPPLTTDDYLFVELVDFVYNVSSAHTIQTFPVRDEVRKLGIDVGLLVLEIVGNWGGDSTCIYRVRIHGVKGDEEPLSLTKM